MKDDISLKNKINFEYIVPHFNIHFLEKKEQIDLFLSNKCVQNIYQNKNIFTIFINLINSEKTNLFNFLLNKSSISNENISKIFTQNHKVKNYLDNSRSFSIIERCLQLNRIEILKILINKVGFIDTNYYNLLFSNIHYSLFNQKKRLDLLHLLKSKNYKFQNNFINLSITNYTSKFLDVWKYNKLTTIYSEYTNHITPLHNLAKVKNFNKIKLYIDYFIDNKIININCKDIFNRTPITYAIEYNNLDYCKFLIEQKCDIMNIDKYKCNIFHYLCIQDNSYDNNLFFCKIWNFLKFNIQLEELLSQINMRGYTPIDYLLHKGRFIVYQNIYNFNYIKCSTANITTVQEGFNYYFNSIQKYRKYVENTYEFKEYLKLIKLLIRECMDFKLNDLVSNVKNSDVFYKVCKYLDRV